MSKASNRNLLLLSSSNVFGYEYMQFAEDEIQKFLSKHGVTRVLFIPYASFDYNNYSNKVSPVFKKLGFEIDGIHTFNDPKAAVRNAQAIFVGGGNTFLLLRTLYDQDLIDPIRQRVLRDGMPYIGSSAGTNVATWSISTTNDMPIIRPPTFEALNLIPFNINPHYYEEPESQHKGETRAERIMQYHQMKNTPPVLGLREGSMLLVERDVAKLIGIAGAVLFQPGEEPKELSVESDVSDLLRCHKGCGSCD